jgi:ureidoglycolate hydrolase
MEIQAFPLTPWDFAPFGQVLMAENETPERKPWAAKIDNLRQDARANVTYMSLEPDNYPVEVMELERHRFSHQLFVPLKNTVHLVVVCHSLADGTPDMSSTRAFHAAEGQSVNYNLDVWHAPRMVLKLPGSFIMIRWDTGVAGDDTELITLSQPLVVAAPIPVPRV